MKKGFLFLLIIGITGPCLDKQQKTKEPEKLKFGLHFDSLSHQQKTDNNTTQGVIINKVEEGHPAKAAGILVGDIITQINDISIKDQAHCVQVMKNVDVAPGFALVKIIRNKKTIEVTVNFK